MFFLGYLREMNPQVGLGIPGAEEGAQMMQLAQVQPTQIVSSAVSQALTAQHAQQTASNPPSAAAASTAAVEQIQFPIKFDVPVFENDGSTASWLA